MLMLGVMRVVMGVVMGVMVMAVGTMQETEEIREEKG